MGISGNLKTMALAELLQWLSQGHKTGTLVIDGEKVKKRIFFEDGIIIASASTDPKEYLGHFLIAHGYISEEAVNEAVARQKEEGQLIGKILVNMGVLTEDDLQQMLQLKSEESIYDLFTWEAGEFNFLDDDLPAQTFIRMNMDVQWIVLEGSRRRDEWARIKEWVPTPMYVPVLIIDPDTVEMEEVDRRILAWVDDDRTVEEISQGCQTSLFMISSTIAEHAQRGHLKVVRPRVIEVVKEVVVEKVVEREVPSQNQAPPQQQQQPPQQSQMPQMPQGYPQGYPPQMMPGQMPMGYPQGYPGMAGYDPPSGQVPVYNPQQMQQMQQQMQGGGGVAVSGRTLHFAGGGGGAPPTPSAPRQSDAERLLQEAKVSLNQGVLNEALTKFRRARDAHDSTPTIQNEVKAGEDRVVEALENNGVRTTSVPRLECDMGELTKLDISPQEGFMLTRIDGSYDIASILKMSPMPKIDALMLFWKLKKSGHVRIG